MPPPRQPAKPTMHCRQCQYVLDGLPENRRPECGTAFDPANPSTFFRASDLADGLWQGGKPTVALRIQLYLAVFLFGCGLLTTVPRPQGYYEYLVRRLTLPRALILCVKPFSTRWSLSVTEHLLCSLLLLLLVTLTPLFIRTGSTFHIRGTYHSYYLSGSSRRAGSSPGREGTQSCAKAES